MLALWLLLRLLRLRRLRRLWLARREMDERPSQQGRIGKGEAEGPLQLEGTSVPEREGRDQLESEPLLADIRLQV